MKPHHACYFLFNKVYPYPAPADPDEAAFELTKDKATPFWCLKTNEAFGPDGGPVDEECCVDGRPCFKREVDVDLDVEV